MMMLYVRQTSYTGVSPVYMSICPLDQLYRCIYWCIYWCICPLDQLYWCITSLVVRQTSYTGVSPVWWSSISPWSLSSLSLILSILRFTVESLACSSVELNTFLFVCLFVFCFHSGSPCSLNCAKNGRNCALQLRPDHTAVTALVFLCLRRNKGS